MPQEADQSAQLGRAGVFKILEIEPTNKRVGAKTSNLQENTWSHLRHVDNAPEFHGAQRPGPNDPENRNAGSVPYEMFECMSGQAFGGSTCRALTAG